MFVVVVLCCWRRSCACDVLSRSSTRLKERESSGSGFGIDVGRTKDKGGGSRARRRVSNGVGISTADSCESG